LPIWVRIIEKASRLKYPDGDFRPPEPVVQVELCSVSNQIATDACRAAGTAYQISLPQSMCPTQICQVHHGQILGPDEEPDPSKNPFPQRVLHSLKRLFGD